MALAARLLVGRCRAQRGIHGNPPHFAARHDGFDVAASLLGKNQAAIARVGLLLLLRQLGKVQQVGIDHRTFGIEDEFLRQAGGLLFRVGLITVGIIALAVILFLRLGGLLRRLARLGGLRLVVAVLLFWLLALAIALGGVLLRRCFFRRRLDRIRAR